MEPDTARENGLAGRVGGDTGDDVVRIDNAQGRGAIVLLCDHASRRLPADFGDLGLDAAARRAHIAWDPGALGVSRHLSGLLDAPLVWPDLSRLVIDCNRDTAAPDLIPALSELTEVPGNRDLSGTERARRIALAHTPFHARIGDLLDARAAAGLPSVVVSIHSYTPVYKGVSRPWPVGILSNRDRRVADAMIADLARQGIADIGDNQPYAPGDGVYYTVGRHGEARGLACVMVEVRNDEIMDAAGESLWAVRLEAALKAALTALGEGG
ncbi:N-formylglutamate amidohydrolase [Stappia sp.]|uniref:N-formylglutamate amidohydrolase n=1 Tax=Stappia sp. TaxID=1870903 RepID=UPI003A996613